jgi:hypothetical protein
VREFKDKIGILTANRLRTDILRKHALNRKGEAVKLLLGEFSVFGDFLNHLIQEVQRGKLDASVHLQP